MQGAVWKFFFSLRHSCLAAGPSIPSSDNVLVSANATDTYSFTVDSVRVLRVSPAVHAGPVASSQNARTIAGGSYSFDADDTGTCGTVTYEPTIVVTKAVAVVVEIYLSNRVGAKSARPVGRLYNAGSMLWRSSKM